MTGRIGRPRGGVWIGLLGALIVAGAPPARGDPAAPPAAVHRRVGRSGIDRRVALLTKALGLDAWQQAALRKVLVDGNAQERRIWSDGSLPSANRIAATKALSRHTADRIRALLNAAQLNRYDPPPADGPAQAITGARVEDWMTTRNAERGARAAVVAGALRDGPSTGGDGR